MFNGIWLVASETLTVKGRTIEAGERFELPRIKAGPLLVLGRAMIAQPQTLPKAEPDAPPKRRRGRPRKTETSESPRQYRRRDLEAEE